MNENNQNDQWPSQDQQAQQNAPAPGMQPYGTPPQGAPNPYGAPPAYGMPPYGEDTSVMTTKDWIVTYLILMIPCVGWIMPFVWAFGSGNVNRRNWARAVLILVAIGAVLSLIFWIVFFVIIGAAVDSWYSNPWVW